MQCLIYSKTKKNGQIQFSFTNSLINNVNTTEMLEYVLVVFTLTFKALEYVLVVFTLTLKALEYVLVVFTLTLKALEYVLVGFTLPLKALGYLYIIQETKGIFRLSTTIL